MAKSGSKKSADQRRIERRDGERELSGGLEREKRGVDGKRFYDQPDTSSWKGDNVAGYINRLKIDGVIDSDGMVKASDDYIEENRFKLMGAAREMVRSGAEGGNPTYVVAGAKIYDSLGVNADGVIRRSLRQSLEKMNSYDDEVPNPGNLDLSKPYSPKIKKRVQTDAFGNGTRISDEEVREAREMLSKYESKHKAYVAGIISAVGFLGSIVLFSRNLTGNVVGATNAPLNAVGAILFLICLVSFFFYSKNKSTAR